MVLDLAALPQLELRTSIRPEWALDSTLGEPIMSSPKSDPITGHCACSAVQFKLRQAPMFVHCCHCLACQRETGSAFAVNALIETSAVEITAGTLETIRIPTASGKGQLRCQCDRCHTVLYSHYAGAGTAIAFVKVGTLEQPDRIQPDIHIYTATRQPWIRLPDDLPTSEAFYRFADHWPEDCLNRYKAAQAAH